MSFRTDRRTIPLFKPSYGEEEVDALREPLRNGWTGLGPKTKAFEERFAGYIGTRYAVGVSSGTAALQLALRVAGVEGGEVVTTPMTFISTNHAILHNQATPVFSDIEADTLNIAVEEIRGSLTESTRAIVVVHFGGHACDMDPILEIAGRRDIPVVEDVAHGCGGEYKGRKLGSIGSFGCFSFQAVKNLSTADGGMITTNDEAAYRRLVKLRWMGITHDTWSRIAPDDRYVWRYDVDEVGCKCHMNDLTAAIGLVQLAKLDRMNERRRELFSRYDRLLAGVPGVEIPACKPYAGHASHIYAIKVDRREELGAFLRERGVSTGVHYYPNNLYEIYGTYGRETPVAWSVWKRLLTLPLYPDMTFDEQDRVVEGVVAFIEKQKEHDAGKIEPVNGEPGTEN